MNDNDLREYLDRKFSEHEHEEKAWVAEQLDSHTKQVTDHTRKAPVNGEKVWRDRVLFFLAVAGAVGGMSTAVFITRGEARDDHHAIEAAAVEVHRVQFVDHERLPAHREQIEVNRRLTDSIDRVEALVREVAVEVGISRAAVRRIAPPPPPDKPQP